MDSNPDDSLMLSLQELQQMEADRLRDAQRQKADAEALRETETRRETERVAARREAEAHARATEAQAEVHAREEAAHQAAMVRAARELALRAEIEATAEARRLDRVRAHEETLATLAQQHPRGMSTGVAVVLALAVVIAVGVAGYALVVAPMVRSQTAQVRLLEDRAARAESAARTAREQTATAERAVRSMPVVTAVTTFPPRAGVVVPQESVRTRPPRRGQRPVTTTVRATEPDPTANLETGPGGDPRTSMTLPDPRDLVTETTGSRCLVDTVKSHC